jgi:multicomponent Na+:H+ antiporter subunit D
MTDLAPWTVVLPLAGGCLALLVRAHAGLVGMATAIATLLAAMGVGWGVWSQGATVYVVGGWRAPLGIGLQVDGLGAVMLLTAGVAGLCIVIYSLGYFAHGGSEPGWQPRDHFWPVMLFLWAALNLLFLSADAFNLYVALELMTLAAVALMTLEGERTALMAAMRYLLAAFVGSLAYLLGVALLYASFHTLDLALLGERMAPTAGAMTAAALITVGLALKTALFPLHFWLPRAHASAPAPVSAALSALVITGSFYLLLRLWFGAFPAVLTPAAAQFVGALGAAAIVWGSLQAIRQQRLKLMIAYSTVSQIGYLFLLLPLATFVAPAVALEAWSGGIYHAVSHAFAKSAMFLAAGAIVHGLGHDRIVGISGIATGLPIATYAFGIAGITLIGLPPTGGFIAKWMMLSAALQSGQWWWAVVILTGGVLTAGYVFLVLGQELSEAEREERPVFAPVPRRMEYAAMLLAVIGLLLGLRAVEPLQLLQIGNPFECGVRSAECGMNPVPSPPVSWLLSPDSFSRSSSLYPQPYLFPLSSFLVPGEGRGGGGP